MDETKDLTGEGRELAPFDGQALDASRSDKHRLFIQTLNEAQVDFLLQRTPKHEIKMRPGRGGLQFAYVEHGYVTERLNLVFGFNWDFEVVDKQILDEEVIVEAKLTVRTPGGQTIVKTQFGGADIKRHNSGAKSGRPLSIADDFKAAASDALKKCASLLGIGLDLYGRDRPEEAGDEPPGLQAYAGAAVTWDSGNAAGPVDVEAGAKVRNITANRSGYCTPVQEREIARLAVQTGRTMADLCSSLGVQEPGDLTEARAERVIRRLSELAKQQDTQAS